MNDDTHPLRSSDSIAAIACALSKAQSMFRPLTKDRVASIETKTGGRYSYEYIGLPAVLEGIRAPLAQNEIAIVQAVSLRDHHIVVETRLAHSSGEWFSSELAHQVADGADPRSVGSLITYLRRYSALSMVGVAPENEDDDAAEASARTPLRTAKAKLQTSKPAAPVSEAADTSERAPAQGPALNPKDRVELRPITTPQLKKIWAIARSNGWTEDTFVPAVAQSFGVRSPRDLRQGDVDQCLEIAHRRPPSTNAAAATAASAAEEPF